MLLIGWGSTMGAIEEAVTRLRGEGLRVASMHLRFLQPMPSGIREILARFKHAMTIEGNWSDSLEDELIDEDNRRYSALAMMLRSRFLVDIDCWSEARGQPIKPSDICRVVRAALQRKGTRIMSRSLSHCVIKLHEEHHDLEDYQGGVPRWCNGCGDNAILAAMQRLCSEEELAPENTVFVSGIGCSSRLPHYMKTYGFHGLHGRAFPVAEGIKIARPDLNVFVSTGDGDCCSIGAAHWIHALRYNINLTVVLHDNHVYGLTKKQASPTSPRGLKSNTTPYGALLEPMNPLTVSLGVQGASFVAQAVDWIPEVLYDIMRAAFRHRGFSFVRVLQRCPEFMPKAFDPWLHDPQRTLLLTHADGSAAQPGPRAARTATSASTIRSTSTRRARSPRSTTRSRSASCTETRDAPCYEDLRHAGQLRSPEYIRAGLEPRARQVHRLAEDDALATRAA